MFEDWKMPVPAEIRAVPRPRNTIVVDRGGDGPKRYAVRARAGAKYGPHGKTLPINGQVIGHIIQGAFVPITPEKKLASTGPQELSFGAAAFAHSVSLDLFRDLTEIYDVQNACEILAIALIRSIKPDVKNRRLATEYRRTYISRYLPGLHLSGNHVGKLLEGLGMDRSKREAFFAHRIADIEADHHVLIDGMLKQDTSTVNDFSAYSYKAHVKGCKDISIIYAYDIEKMEPVCAEVFAGNRVDASAFATFVRDQKLTRGIIVADKGFPPSQIQDELIGHPDLHYLIPIKRTDSRIRNNDMLKFQGVLTAIDGQVHYCKKKLRTNRFLYAFKDHAKADGERYAFIEKMKTDPTVTEADFEAKSELFGVIVFESDLDLSPLTAYLCYEDRWQIELVFDAYKNDELLDRTNVQGDFSVRGSEFINFLTTVLTCRMRHKAQRAGLLGKLSYRDLLEDLGTAWRKVEGPLPPKSDDEYWVADYKGAFTLMEALGLSDAGIRSKRPDDVTHEGVVIPRKPGRPRVRPEFVGPKRPRGRPRKLQ